RVATRDRIPVARRRDAGTRARHGRLSGRMADRPAALDDELRSVVRRKLEIIPATAPLDGRRALARLPSDTGANEAGQRKPGYSRSTALHHLPSRVPRGALLDEPAAARPLPAARRSCRVAGAHFCAAGFAHRWRRTGGVVVGDDAAAI